MVQDKKKRESAFQIALLLTIQFINAVIVTIIGNKAGIMDALFILLFSLFAITSIKYGVNKIKLHSIMLILTVITIYLFSYWFYSDVTSVNITFFLSFCVFPYIIMFNTVDIESVLTYILKISIVALPVANKIFMTSYGSTTYDSISMGMSYAILPVIIAAFVHFYYYRGNTTLFIKMTYIINVYYAIKVISLGNRGAVLSLLCPLLLVSIFQVDQYGHKRKVLSLKYVFFLIMLSIATLVLVMNFYIFLKIIYNYFASHGINIAFLLKTIILIEDGDIGNGRSQLIKLGIEGFIKSPIWGNGIGTFGYKNSLSILYPHNIFVQLLYDGGLILTIPVVFWLVYCSSRILKTKQLKEGYPIFIILFSTSIPRLMVSADIWKVQSFWMLMGFLMANFGYIGAKNKKFLRKELEDKYYD